MIITIVGATVAGVLFFAIGEACGRRGKKREEAPTTAVVSPQELKSMLLMEKDPSHKQIETLILLAETKEDFDGIDDRIARHRGRSNEVAGKSSCARAECLGAVEKVA
jgi:hypothetical protein